MVQIHHGSEDFPMVFPGNIGATPLSGDKTASGNRRTDIVKIVVGLDLRSHLPGSPSGL